MRGLSTMVPMMLLAMPGCMAANNDRPTTPAPAEKDQCVNDGLEAYAGRKVSAELGAELLAKSGAKSLRWGPPGAAMTMDFRPDRLTVAYDEAMLVTSARCG